MKRALALAAMAILGCGDGGDGGADAGDPDTVELRGPCAFDSRLGGFAVEAGADLSSIAGKVENAVHPVTILEETLADGDCRLLRRPNPQCDPACTASQVCDLDGSCRPAPRAQNVGVVTIAGLIEDVEMSPVEPGNNYFATGVPNPPFVPGALVTLTSTEGVYGELRLAGVAPQPMTVLDGDWIVQTGSPLAVTWSAPEGDVRTSIRLELNIDQHGLTPVTIVCDLADTGAATISATMIDAMFDAGLSGFPRGTLTRHTVDSQAVADGCVDFVVAAPRSHSLRVGAAQ